MSESQKMSEKIKGFDKAKADKLAQRIIENSTLSLMLAVLLYFIGSLFGTYTEITATGTSFNAFILGTVGAGNNNLIVLKGMGGLFAVFEALFSALVRLFAGLSFAAVCFDESKHIYFRVVAVAAVCLVLFGGLAIF